MNDDTADLPEPAAPHTVLFAQVRRRLYAVPFVPFRIVTTSGRAYDVPTSDHAGILPWRRMVIVATDRGGAVDIHGLHIASIEDIDSPRHAA